MSECPECGAPVWLVYDWRGDPKGENLTVQAIPWLSWRRRGRGLVLREGAVYLALRLRLPGAGAILGPAIFDEVDGKWFWSQHPDEIGEEFHELGPHDFVAEIPLPDEE